MFSFTNNETVTWRGRGAGVKNKIQGAGPCFGWIFADDLQRLAPQEKRFASPGQSSIDRTWWDKFKNFVSTRALIAKHLFFYWRYICPCKRVHIDMFSFTNNETVTWRGRGAGVKNKIQGAGPFFGWILADDLQRLAPRGKVATRGQPLKIIREYSAKKRSSPLDFIFDTCASTSSSHCLNVCDTEHIYVYSFAWTNVSSVKKHVFCT